MKKLRVALAATLLLLALFGSLLMRSTKPIVIGTLRDKDRTEIMSLVRHAKLHKWLGPSGMRSVGRIPTAVNYYISHPVARIEVKEDNKVEVLYPQRWRQNAGYVLRKGTNGWTIIAELFY